MFLPGKRFEPPLAGIIVIYIIFYSVLYSCVIHHFDVNLIFCTQKTFKKNRFGSQTSTIAAPTNSGNTSFADFTQVMMSAESGSEIRYMTEGSTPTAESSLYSEALTIPATTTVKAIAIKNGVSSEVTSKMSP